MIQHVVRAETVLFFSELLVTLCWAVGKCGVCELHHIHGQETVPRTRCCCRYVVVVICAEQLTASLARPSQVTSKIKTDGQT